MRVGQTIKKNAGLGVLRRFLPPAPRGSCGAAPMPAALLSPEMPRDAQPPLPRPAFGDRPENAGSESEVPRGCRGQPGKIHRSESPCCGVEGGIQGSANPIIDTDPQKGCFRAQRGSSRMLHGGHRRRSPWEGRARALWGAAPISHAAHKRALENHLFSKAVFP